MCRAVGIRLIDRSFDARYMDCLGSALVYLLTTLEGWSVIPSDCIPELRSGTGSARADLDSSHAYGQLHVMT